MISTIDKIKAAQIAVGSYPDGKDGPSTWDAFYRFLNYEGYINIDFPYYNYQWGSHIIWMKPEQLRLVSGEGKKLSVGSFKYAMSGSFTYPSGIKPCSFLVEDGKIIYGLSCHAYPASGGKPETVISWSDKEYLGLSLCRYSKDLPEGVKTAIGGLRLIHNGMPVRRSYNEEKEGFTGPYSDVFRTTQHCGIGVDKYGNVGLMLNKRCSLATFKQKAINVGFVDFVSIDGGSVSAMNSPDFNYRKHQKQGYIITAKEA